ncbi:MAG: IPExxxVDY family protein [Bacteroidetes bacterium]|nr:IPExxxVDY family protein [Bacteroidota bacterium]
MKSIQRITRVQLKINQKDEFILLGIVSAEPDYKLSLSINKKFRVSLKNILPLKITDDTGSELAFSRFSDSSKSPDVVFNLFSNRSDKSFLLKKLKNVDYIFQVQDAENENNTDQITASMREIESVNAVFNIDINTFKDKNLQYLTQ